MISPPRDNLLRIALASFAIAALATLAPHTPIAGDIDAPRIHEGHAGPMPMSDEAMASWVREFYEKNPVIGRHQATGAPVATFLALNTSFNADGNSGTVVDTVTIMLGETVRWQRIIGSHTVTSGTGPADPNVASLFDTPLDAAAPVFDFTFNSEGTVPFFCRPHLDFGFDMRGVVIVESSVGVTPLPGSAGEIGFTRNPAPNPTRGTMSFRFALAERGHAIAQVFDARGRLVAELVNDVLEPGAFGALWDGRDRAGNGVAPGVYFVNLDLPGYRESRRVIIAR